MPRRLPLRLLACGGFVLATLSTPQRALPEAEPETGVAIEVVVHGTDRGGVLNWALYATEAGYEDDESVAGGRVPANGGTTTLDIPGIEPGTYAMAIFLDVDADEDFDTNFLGIPKEPFGFSNDAISPLGRPDFADAAFEVGPDGAQLTLTLMQL